MYIYLHIYMFHIYTYTYITYGGFPAGSGEGNGNLLQYSCLENPRDGGASWAAVYGVTQSWTWLKWLSSSSSSRWLNGKESPYQCERFRFTGSIPVPWRGNGNPLQYSCMGNHMDRGAWRATVHGVSKSQTQLSNWEHTHAYNIQMCRYILYTQVLHFLSL